MAIFGLTTTALGQAASKSKEGPGEAEAIEQVRARARKARLGAFEISRRTHFLCVGDAPRAYREDALDLSEALAKDFLAYFRPKGFKVAYPDRRMTVVALKDVGSFAAYIGEDVGEDVGGQYELDSNQLVIFDLRSLERQLDEVKKRQNTLALVHETIHMLSFNSGLLSRGADVPVCISEGLATYGELWLRSRGQKAFGTVNEPRLAVLSSDQPEKSAWIPLEQLLGDDELFFKQETAQVAYAESWLLVSSLLKGPPARLQKFQAYLAGLPKVGEPRKRIEYAESQLGSIRSLEKDIHRFRLSLPRR
jgi:Protein of unknown function (DUF1570)